MADYLQEVELSRKVKLFYIDFAPLLAYAHGNIIHILNGKELHVITVCFSLIFSEYHGSYGRNNMHRCSSS